MGSYKVNPSLQAKYANFVKNGPKLKSDASKMTSRTLEIDP